MSPQMLTEHVTQIFSEAEIPKFPSRSCCQPSQMNSIIPEFLWLVRNKSFPLGEKMLSQLTVTGNEMSSARDIPLRGTCHIGFRVQLEK
ncbi:hypothetical protein CDAR_309311 [Caerostris darwini]|uniref:Uncharacterized protein n=1 Tax=Caerostris darwini TaxID=1538125 RepID=A0AAV4WQH7_9ARAC|nr:hypothetical protein CDAR_309311 [Caerostris darwini]